MEPHSLEASSGPSHDAHVKLPDDRVVLITIDSCDIHGVDYTVQQSKVNLLKHNDVKAHVTDPNKFSLVLTKGRECIVMTDSDKTIDYLSKITGNYTLEIRLNQH